MGRELRMLLDIVLIVIAMLLSSCGSPSDTLCPCGKIDAETVPYVLRFMEQADKQGVGISIKTLSIEFTDEFSYTNLGYCSYGKVTLNRKYWNNLNDERRELLVFHELGHCVLNLEHHPEAGHIMSPMAITTYGDKKDLLIYELFH